MTKAATAGAVLARKRLKPLSPLQIEGLRTLARGVCGTSTRGAPGTVTGVVMGSLQRRLLARRVYEEASVSEVLYGEKRFAITDAGRTLLAKLDRHG